MKKFIEPLKTALVALLLISFVCLTLIYISTFDRDKQYEFTEEMDAAVRNQSYKSEYIGYFTNDLIDPYFIGYSVNGSTKGLIGNDATAAYEMLKNSISLFIGPDVDVKRDNSKDFTSYLKGNYVIVKYQADLPKSVLFYAQNPDSILETVSSEYIHEMVIVLDEEPYMVARNMSGNIYTYKSKSESAISVETVTGIFSQFGGRRFEYAYRFDADDSLKSLGYADKVLDTTVLLNDNLSNVSAVIDIARIRNTEVQSTILTAFGMNPEKVTSHTDDDGITFFDEGHNVTAAYSGTVKYSALAESGGIDLQNLIGYNFSEESYSVVDCAGAALVLAHRLGLIEDSLLKLAVGCIETSDNVTTVGLIYTYDGYTVVTENGYALEIEIQDGQIVSATVCIFAARAYDGSTTYSEGLWPVRADLYTSEELSDYKYVYTVKNSRLVLSLVKYSGGQ